MSGSLEVPRLADLQTLAVEVVPQEEVGVVSVTAAAADGATVTLTWDEIACSAEIRWRDSSGERLRIEREAVTEVAVRENGEGVEFRVWLRRHDLAGQLVVRVGSSVSVSDTILRA